MDETEVVFAVPDHEGAGALIGRGKPGEALAGPDETRAGLKKFGGVVVVLAGRKGDVLSIENPGAKKGGGVEGTSYFTSSDDETERGPVGVEESSVDGG